MPITPLSGVRSSWLMFATNSDFRREDSIAWVWATASAAWMRLRVRYTRSPSTRYA